MSTYIDRMIAATTFFNLLTLTLSMVGRPKNPNRPPTVTAVRITARTQGKLKELHRIWGSNEPYNNTVERALDELAELRKKVKVLQLVNEGLNADLEAKSIAFDRLFNVHNDTKKQLVQLQQCA